MKSKVPWTAEGPIEGVAWYAKLDGRYMVEVQYEEGGDGYRGTLCVFDHDDADRLLHVEPTDIAYAARFGADIEDVARWQERAMDVVDNPRKREVPEDK